MRNHILSPSCAAIALVLAAGVVNAQNAPTATWIVRADAECKLTVDGEAKGTLRPDDRMRVVLQLGEHLVEAVPVAGGKRWEQVVNLNEAKTQILTINLPKAPAPTTSAAPANAPKPPSPADVAAAGAAVTASRGYWLDFTTKLMWAARDNGQDVNWAQANAYCKNLTTGNFSDWRLPRVQELSGLRADKTPKGGVKSTGIAWSGFKGSLPNTAAAYSFPTAADLSVPVETTQYYRALCVRGPLN